MKRSILMALAALAASFSIAHAEVATGSAAPNFTLNDINGNTHSLTDYRGKTVVLEWVNHGCPFVVKHYDSDNIPAMQREAAEKGIVWLSICSSAPGKQGHHDTAKWQKVNADKKGAATAVLLDEDGTIGKAYGAKTTPHMYVINAEGTLVYQGAIDNKPSTDPEDIPSSLNYVKAALDDIAAGRAVATPQTKPYGCSVKYK